jgi:phosphatidylglycerol:prolipoprotein diacylglycerol transferase
MSKRKKPGKPGPRTAKRPTPAPGPGAASAAPAGSGLDRLLGSAAAAHLVAPTAAPDARVSADARVPRSARDERRLAPVRAGCDVLHDITPQSVAVAYTFTTRDQGEPYDVPLRVVGRLLEPASAPEGAQTADHAIDRFDVTRTIPSVLPGVGQVTATLRVPDVRPGRWHVTVTDTVHDARYETESVSGFGRVLAEAGPGVSLGAWPATVALGAVLGIALLGWLADREGLPAWPVVLLSVAASLVGVVGAKVYYLAQSTRRVGMLSSAGMCIQGFVLAALATLLLGAAALQIPPLVLADLAAPGLMFGMAIGRLGCYYGGCCTGRMSAHRGALRSSDRYLLVRRIPVQLIEGAAAAALGLVALGVLLTRDAHPAGVLGLATLGSYVLVRQLLFSLRSTPRRTRIGRPVVGAVSAAFASASALVLLTH